MALYAAYWDDLNPYDNMVKLRTEIGTGSNKIDEFWVMQGGHGTYLTAKDTDFWTASA